MGWGGVGVDGSDVGDVGNKKLVIIIISRTKSTHSIPDPETGRGDVVEEQLAAIVAVRGCT